MAGELAQSFGAQMTARREELKLSQHQVAERIGGKVNNQRVSEWERGVYMPGERYQAKIAEALETTVSALYEPVASGTPDMIGAMNGTPSDDTADDRLRRIESKLDQLIARFADEDDEGDDGLHGPFPQPRAPVLPPDSAQSPTEQTPGQPQKKPGARRRKPA